jgi:hypothetical protein
MATTYTDAAAVNAYIGVTDVSDAEINQAEADLDDLALGAWKRQTTAPFRKLIPAKVSAAKADGLARATAEQVKYRRLMGEEFFTRPQRDKGSVDGVSYEGTLPHIAPRALAILADVGLVVKSGRPSTMPASNIEEIGWEEV